MLIHNYHIKHKHAHARNRHGYDDNMTMLISTFTKNSTSELKVFAMSLFLESKDITSPIQPFQSNTPLIKHHPVNKT